MAGFKQYLAAAELARKEVQVGDAITFDVNGIRLIEGKVIDINSRHTLVEIFADTQPTSSPISGNSGTQKETYLIKKDGTLRSAGQTIEVGEGDKLIIYMDPRFQSWDEIVVKRRDGATIRNIDADDPNFKKIFDTAEDLTEDMLFILWKKGSKRLSEIRTMPTKKENKWCATIWSDILTEEESRNQFHYTQAAVIPAAWVFPDCSNNFYAMYRFGISMAMSPEATAKIKDTSVLGNDLMTLGYTEAERHIIEKSAKAMGFTPIRITTPQSAEPHDTNIQSPVQPKGPVKRKS